MVTKDTFKKEEKKARVNITLDKKLHERFQELCKEEFKGVTLSNTINNMLKESIQFMEDTIKNKQEDISKNV